MRKLGNLLTNDFLSTEIDNKGDNNSFVLNYFHLSGLNSFCVEGYVDLPRSTIIEILTHVKKFKHFKMSDKMKSKLTCLSMFLKFDFSANSKAKTSSSFIY